MHRLRMGATAALASMATAAVALPVRAQAPGAAEASSQSVPATQVFAYLDAYLQLPPAERSLFTVGYYLRRGGAPAHEMEAVLVAPSGRRPLTIGEDGRILPLPDLEQFRTGRVEFRAPPGPEFKIAVKPLALLRSATTLDASLVARAIAQGDGGMHEAAGVKAIFLPDLTRAVFVDAGRGVAHRADGREMPLPGGDRPYYEPSTLPGVLRLTFSRPPSAILLHSADDKHR